MNFAEAVRLLDLGHTPVEVRSETGDVTGSGVAVGVEIVQMVTVALPDGSRVAVPAEQVDRVS